MSLYDQETTWIQNGTVVGTLFLLSDLPEPSKSVEKILYKTLEGKTFDSPTCKASGLHINNL